MSGRPSTQVHGRHKETPHYTSTDDRSVCSHQQDIDCDTCNCEPVGSAFAEEAPQAYKDIESVVNISTQAGLSKKVARLKPLGVIKG